MAAAAVEASCAAASGGLDARMELLCIHVGGLVPRVPGGALRCVGGETRVLVVPRSATYRDLAARAAGKSGGAEVRAVRHRLADEELEDMLVSLTCDTEFAHMRDEYDRLRATRPAARFRVFVTTAPASAGSGGGSPAAVGLPQLAPKIRCVQSERAQLHRRPAIAAPVRRVQSAQEFARAIHAQPPSPHHQVHHHRHQQCCCRSFQRHGLCGVRARCDAGASDVRSALHVQESNCYSVDACGEGSRAERNRCSFDAHGEGNRAEVGELRHHGRHWF